MDGVRPIGVDGGSISTIGGIFRYDTRDNVNLSTRGWYITATGELNAQFLGSDFNFSRLTLDAIKYTPIASGHIVAANIYCGNLWGDVPFQELLFLGGPKRARGIVQGRYRDKSLALAQLAYRFPIFGRFRGNVFSSLGRVGEDFSGLSDGDLHFNYGAGLRILLDPKEGLMLRLDVGLGSDEVAYYFTVGGGVLRGYR